MPGLSGNTRTFLKLVVNNVFNNAAVTAVDTTVFTNDSDATLTRFNPFTETPVEGTHWRKETGLRPAGRGRCLSGGEVIQRRSGGEVLELHRHLSRDRPRDPPLRRLAQHHRLRIEPASLVEQPSEPAAVLRVLLDLVAHAETMTPADAVRLEHDLHAVCRRGKG